MYTPVTNRFSAQQTLSVAIAGGGVAASVSFTLTGPNGLGAGYVVVFSTVACFIAFNGAATNGAGASGIPIPANTPVPFWTAGVTSVGVNGATAGTLVVFGAA